MSLALYIGGAWVVCALIVCGLLLAGTYYDMACDWLEDRARDREDREVAALEQIPVPGGRWEQAW